MYKASNFLLLPLRLHFSQLQTFASLMDPNHLRFYLFFQFLILPLLISVYAQFHHRLLSRLPWWLLLITLITFLFLSTLLTRPIQFNRLILTNEGISKSPNSWINSLLYRFLQFLFTLISPNLFLKTFLPKAASRQEYLYSLSKILLHMLPPLKLQFLYHRKHTFSRNFNFPEWSAALLGE